jgi:mono/diheme cytochrome c family protein
MLRGFVLLLAISVSSAVMAAQAIKKVSPQPTSPASGDEMFKTYCAACHGKEGKGDGPAAPALKKSPANLTELTARNGGKFPELRVFNAIQGDPEVVSHGSKDMPVWGSVFSSLARGQDGQVQMRISNLTAYIKSIQVKK